MMGTAGEITYRGLLPTDDLDLISMYTRKGFRFIEHVRWPEVNYRSMIFSKTLR
jgi:hypothetical protein